MQKIIFAVRAKPGLSRAEALGYLRTNHGPLVTASATLRTRLKAYVQNHISPITGVNGFSDDRDWVIESWNDPKVVLPEPPVAADAILVREDEGRFPDRTTLMVLRVDERLVWSVDCKTVPANASLKIFTFFNRQAGLTNEGFARAWEQAAATLAAHSAFQRYARSFVRNICQPGRAAAPNPNGPPTPGLVPAYDGVDVWRFASKRDVEEFFEHPEVQNALTAYGEAVMPPNSMSRYLTQEHVIFDDVGIYPGL